MRSFQRSFTAVLLGGLLATTAPAPVLAQRAIPDFPSAVGGGMPGADAVGDEPDPYAFVRQLLHASGDETGVALCEQDLAAVELGLPDPGRSNQAGSRFAAAAERQQMLQLLFLGARTTGDPAESLAHVMVLVAMLDGAAYADAVSRVVTAQTSAPPRDFDCERPLDEQMLAPPGIAAPGLFDQERHAYVVSCGGRMSEMQLLDDQSRMLDEILVLISQVYNEPLLGGRNLVGETSGGGSGPPRYVVNYRDASGNVQVRTLTDGFLSAAEKAYSYRDSQQAFLDDMNHAIGTWNAGASALASRYPLMGMAHLPSASVGGTALSAVSNLSNGFKAGSSGTANLNASMSIVGLAIAALEPKSTGTPAQEKGSVLNSLREEHGGARPSEVNRAEQVMTSVLGSNATITPAPNQSTEPKIEDSTPPLMCPAGPDDPFTGPGKDVSCDETAGAREPVVPVSCQVVIAEVERQYRQGYEWGPEDLSGGERSPIDRNPGSALPCHDTGSNPSHCTMPEPYSPPLSVPRWDGYHRDQDYLEAKARLDALLGRETGELPDPWALPTFGAGDNQPPGATEPALWAAGTPSLLPGPRLGLP